MHRKTRLKLTDLNPLLTCSLCKGYLIDATTLTECLHSFCRSCLVRYLQKSQNCPKCDTLVHKTRPLLNASSSRSARSPGNLGMDRALQNIVYKLVPGLFKDEMKKRRDFYSDHPHAGTVATTSDLEARGEVSDRALVIYTEDEHMNLSLEYFLPYSQKNSAENNGSEDEAATKRTSDVLEDEDDLVHKRYLRCPAAVCVKHIKKFIRNKFDLKPKYQIEITHVDNEEDPLPDDYTLMDVAYIYAWRRIGTLPLVFRVFQETNKKQKTNHVSEPVTVLEKIPDKEDEHAEQNSTQEKETSTNQRTADDPASPRTIVIDNDEKHEDKPDARRTEVVDLTEGGFYRFSTETSLTERHLLPQLRLPMMNIFQTTGNMRLTAGDSFRTTMVESLAERAMSSDKRRERCATPVTLVDDRRLLLDEIVKEKIRMSLLSNDDKSNNNEKSGGLEEHKQNGGDLSMQLNPEIISLDPPSTLSSPVVPVR